MYSLFFTVIHRSALLMLSVWLTLLYGNRLLKTKLAAVLFHPGCDCSLDHTVCIGTEWQLDVVFIKKVKDCDTFDMIASKTVFLHPKKVQIKKHCGGAVKTSDHNTEWAEIHIL